jgi:hypothetical protein
MRLHSHSALLAATLVLAFAPSVVRAQEIPVVTGEHWVQSAEPVKKAYLVGIANLLQVEVAYGGATPSADAQMIAPRMVQGLRGSRQTLDSVRTGLDAWYASHPDRLQRPVIEVIWFEMVVPGNQRSN